MYYVMTNLKPNQAISDPEVFWVLGQTSARNLHIGLSIHLPFYYTHFNQDTVRIGTFLEADPIQTTLIPYLQAHGLAVDLSYGTYRSYDHPDYPLPEPLIEARRLKTNREVDVCISSWEDKTDEAHDLNFLLLAATQWAQRQTIN